jgi:hypothetical protein
MRISECVLRDLEDEPESVVRVDATARLGTDIKEYVLTDRLAGEFCKVLGRVMDAARPPGNPTTKIGVWVSGFFGSGKSHFAKLAGHMLADTPVGADTTRSLFRTLLHAGRHNDDRLAELLQQAASYGLNCHLASFDITRVHTPAAEQNVGLTFLTALYRSLGLSPITAFAEVELELKAAGQYEAFCSTYKAATGREWSDDREMVSSQALAAKHLPQFLPDRHPTVDEALENLQATIGDASKSLDIDRVVDQMLRWLASQPANRRLIFVADEVGAWAGGNLNRIEQIRGLVESLGEKGQGRIWLLVTSQEKLSEVVTNITGTGEKDFLQRLEARFQTNVHLESSEVGIIAEDRILKKKPAGYTELEKLWTGKQEILRDIGEPPGLELGANYPLVDKDGFAKDYPFLPYQLAAAADLFGSMRGVKVSSGARTMVNVAFDATRALGNKDLGALVTWDQIFDAANRDNEFADEQYLGSQGLDYIGTADRDVTDIAFERPSRTLKTLWLVQQSQRIPRTSRNLARLLTASVDTDVLVLEQQVTEALKALEARNFVRREVGTEQWKFLTQDEVTVEKIVRRLSEEVKAGRLRKEIGEMCSARLGGAYNGVITQGVSNTRFEYGVSFGGTFLKNESAPVQLEVMFEGTPSAASVSAGIAATLEKSSVSWLAPEAPRLEERLRRVLAIEGLRDDEEFRRIATERTQAEADKLENEAVQLRREAESEIQSVFEQGKLIYAGKTVALGAQNGSAKAQVEAAIKDRIDCVYTRFGEGDRRFKAENIERLFAAPPGERMAMDPELGVFSVDGHVNSNNVLVEEATSFLKGSMKTTGADITERFSKVPFGWQPDLLRYVAAAMFVDGKVSAADKANKSFDDPRSPQARVLFGTLAFRSTRLIVEEDALTPEETTAARNLLVELGKTPQDSGEIALKDATLLLCTEVTRRSALVEKAASVSLPLPPLFDGLRATLDEIEGAGSRVKVVRALLGHADALGAASAALAQLEAFDRSHGFDQFDRSRRLLRAAAEAGLKDDPTHGTRVEEAEEQTQILIDQRRVLDEWEGTFRTYRLNVLEAFKAVYAPLRGELHRCVAEARTEVTGMPEYGELTLGNRAVVRTQFLGEGKPLAEVALPDMKNEDQLLAANAEYSIAHMRASLAGLASLTGQAKALVLQLHAEEQRQRGEKERQVIWEPAKAFAGRSFETPEEVEEALDAEKKRLMELARQGKIIRVV